MFFPTLKLNALYKNDNYVKGLFSVYGDFGVGKTYFSLQTIINAAKLGKNVLYVYSKERLPVEKINNLLETLSLKERSDTLNNITTIKSNVFKDLMNIVSNLEFFLLNNKKQKKDYFLDLIVIDSITDLYRIELNRDKKEKNLSLNYQLSFILASLLLINEKYGAQILVVNETSLISSNEQALEFQSGGKVMDYWINTSLKISRTEKLNQRKFTVVKHPHGKRVEFTSILTRGGFT